MKIPVMTNSKVPQDEIWFVNSVGKVVGKIRGTGMRIPADNALRLLREELEAKREERAQRIVDRIVAEHEGAWGGLMSQRKWLKSLVLEELRK